MPGGVTCRAEARWCARASEHLHPGLRPKHPRLIGCQNQGLAAGHEVGLAADVPHAAMQLLAQLHLRTGEQEQVHRAKGLAEAPAQALL